MMGLQMLDVAIGLMFIYLVLALACTALVETVAGLVDRRRRNLEKGIANLFGDEALVKKFYDHPLIKALKEDGTPPSYIPAASFSATLIDLLVPVEKAPDPSSPNPTTPVLAPKKPDAVEIRDAISKIDQKDLRRTLLLMLNGADDDVVKFKAAIETWFNNAMDRISAWYKQKTHRWVFVLSLAFVIMSNADTIDIAQQLYTTPSLRQALVAQAQAKISGAGQGSAPQVPPIAQGEKKELPAGDLESIQKLQDLGLKLGWKNYSSACQSRFKNFTSRLLIKAEHKKQSCRASLLTKIIGLLITALAISQGAPFWFDTLNRFISIRGVGKSPAEKEAKKEKDTK
jgi:hypothetical protein